MKRFGALIASIVAVFVMVLFIFKLVKHSPKKEVRVMGMNGCGLGNHLFQVATAISYAENHGYEIILNSASEGILWGSSSFTNRDKIRRNNNSRVPYTHTIFRKLSSRKLHQEPSAQTMFHQYDGDHISPQNNVLQIVGLCQNKELFVDIIPYLPFYLDLYDQKTMHHLMHEYGIHRNQKHNIMVSLRLCQDFAHMTKVNTTTMRNAIISASNGPSMKPKKCRLIVIADVSELDEQWKHVLTGFDYVVIQEDDVSQFYAGLCCARLILGESTYHYWIAVCRQALYPKDTHVYLFENTDLTMRPLCLKGWNVMPLLA